MLDEVNPDGQTWNEAARDKGPYGVFEGKTIFEAAATHPAEPGQRALGYLPSEDEWRFPNIGEDVSTGYAGGELGISKEGAQLPEHGSWFFYLQRLCNHCSYPACLAACPRGAIYKRPEDGVVLIDQERCRGYRKCMEACPYKKTMFRATTRVTEKCIACFPRLEGKDPLSGGKPMETRCMTSCVGKIRLQGLVPIDRNTGQWKDDPSHPLVFLVKKEKVALPLYPQFGTEPNGYYIPPRWVSRAYLRQMFGPGVDEAIERYQAPSRELLAVLQLFRTTQVILDRFEIIQGKKIFETKVNGKKWEMFNDTVIGFDMTGEEAVRTTIEEPFHVRPDKHQNSI
jgi:nitrate reductase beta subunit